MNSFCTAEKERGIAGRPLPIKRESRSSWVTPGHQRLLSIPGHQRLLIYTRASTSAGWIRSSASSTILRLYQVISNFLVYTRGEASYSHQWPPRCGRRFLGRYTPDERFLGRLRVWRLGERDPRFWDDSGQRVSSSRPVSGMSKTVGGRSARLRAAASGGAASTSSRVSGRAARGRG